MGNPALMRNVQAMVPVEVHRTLRDVAYTKGTHLKDLIGEILEDYVVKVGQESQLKRTLSVP